MPAHSSQVLVGRRYLERGFLDAAMRVFLRHPDATESADWTALAQQLLARNRLQDVVKVCEVGAVPLPRKEMLGTGDACLKRRDVEGAIRNYELAGADRERWAQVVDTLASLPGRARQALELSERHLADEAARRQGAGVRMHAVK